MAAPARTMGPDTPQTLFRNDPTNVTKSPRRWSYPQIPQIPIWQASVVHAGTSVMHKDPAPEPTGPKGSAASGPVPDITEHQRSLLVSLLPFVRAALATQREPARYGAWLTCCSWVGRASVPCTEALSTLQRHQVWVPACMSAPVSPRFLSSKKLSYQWSHRKPPSPQTRRNGQKKTLNLSKYKTFKCLLLFLFFFFKYTK